MTYMFFRNFFLSPLLSFYFSARSGKHPALPTTSLITHQQCHRQDIKSLAGHASGRELSGGDHAFCRPGCHTTHGHHLGICLGVNLYGQLHVKTPRHTNAENFALNHNLIARVIMPG